LNFRLFIKDGNGRSPLPTLNNKRILIGKEEFIMKKYFCNPCGYTYDPEKGDPEHGIKPGTAFEDLPDDWCCPMCGVSKSMFQPCIDNYN